MMKHIESVYKRSSRGYDWVSFYNGYIAGKKEQQMNEERKEKYEELKQLVYKCFDAGYAEGLDEGYMLADMLDALVEDGLNVDNVIKLLFDNWKKDRGI